MNKNECPVYDWRKINRQAAERDRLEQQTKNKVNALLNKKNDKKFYPRTKPF